ncbi:MAG TPA: hypothetical protein VGD61_23765 [Pyrinomonadaceae bacterium]
MRIKLVSQKLFTLCVSVLFIVVSVVVSNAQNTTKGNGRGYRGPVLSVSTYTVHYNVENGRLRRGRRRIDSIERFTSDGHLHEEKYFTAGGSILWEYRHAFDSNGRLIESVGTRSKFVYLPERKVYEYDSTGSLIAENGYNLKGQLVNKSEFGYDKAGRKIQWTSMSYHPEENLEPHRWTYSYYDSGLVKEECAFSNKDGSGFLPTDSLGGPHRKLFLYNGQNKPAVVLQFKANGEFAGLESTRYDRRGNELEEVRYGSDGTLKDKTKYVYRFDSFGNPIVQETYEWDEGHRSYQLNEVSYLIIQYRK